MKNQRAKDQQRRMTSPLTARQRSYLGILARDAFKKLTNAHALDDGTDEKEWRHAEAEEACGFTISEAPRSAFDALETRFLTLAGRTKEAFDKASGDPNELRQVHHLITVASREAGVQAGYVQGICKRMFGRPDYRTAEEGRKVLIALNTKATNDARKRQAEALAAAACV